VIAICELSGPTVYFKISHVSQFWGFIMKIVAIVLSILLLSLSAAAQENFTLTVTGEGTVTVPADTVFVTVSVTTSQENVTLASAENAEQLNRTIEALVDAGVQREDILSGRGRSSQRIQTYQRVCNGTNCTIVEDKVVSQITEQITLQLDRGDQDTLDKYLETAEAQGATATVTGYRLSDPGPAMEDARKAAVEDAQKNAEELASAAGLKLDKMLEIYEPWAPSISRRSFGSSSMRWMMTDFFDWPSFGRCHYETASSAEPGMLEVTSYVVVTYQVST
jgi:uncharacterized protein YggE